MGIDVVGIDVVGIDVNSTISHPHPPISHPIHTRSLHPHPHTPRAVAAATAQYRNNAEELLLAMEELANAPSSASNLLQTAGETVDMIKVVQALNEISDLLKVL